MHSTGPCRVSSGQTRDRLAGREDGGRLRTEILAQPLWAGGHRELVLGRPAMDKDNTTVHFIKTYKSSLHLMVLLKNYF